MGCGLGSRLTAAAGLVLVLAGCGGGGLPANAERVSADTWADGPWPFTAAAGVLTCHPDGAVTFEADADGKIYPVNGQATRRRGVEPEIEPIWKWNPDREGARINLGPMGRRGRALCE